MRAKIFSLVFVIWFCVSMVLCCVFSSNENTAGILLIVGQYCAVFGIAIASAKTGSRVLGLFLALLGFGMIGATVLYYWGDQMNIQIDSQDIPLYGGLSLFALFGLLELLLGVTDLMRMKKIQRSCTMPVSARCVELKRTRRKRGKGGLGRRVWTYAPVYEYEYNGETHTVQSHTYSNTALPEQGQVCTLYIDPNKPDEFYDQRSVVTDVILMVVGLVLIAVGALLIYLYYTTAH